MSVSIWHYTWKDCVQSIRDNGFRDGDLGCCYFCKPGDTEHERGELILVVTLNITQEELASYSQPVSRCERFDENLKQYVNTNDQSFFYGFTNYYIPAAFVKEHLIKIREIPLRSLPDA